MSEYVIASEEDAYRAYENRLKREGALDMRNKIVNALKDELLETEANYAYMRSDKRTTRVALRRAHAVLDAAEHAIEIAQKQTVHNLYVREESHGFTVKNFFTEDKTDYRISIGELLDQHRRTDNSTSGFLVECTCGESVDDFIGHLADVRRRMN
jgi:hypothetical protein